MNGFADAGEQRQYISTLSFTAKCNNDHDDEEEDNEYGVDRQLVRMGYRFLVRGCKFL